MNYENKMSKNLEKHSGETRQKIEKFWGRHKFEKNFM
jgi:hypothetical protein